MQFAAVQLDIAWQDKPANHAAIERMLVEAAIEPGAFVVLPELGDTGFSFDLAAIADGTTIPWAVRLAQRLGIWIQPGFAESASDGKGRNCAAIVSPDGRVLGVYRKVHPFTYGRESRFYGGGDRLLLRRCGDAAVCPLICYDLRFPELWRAAALAGANAFTIGASWPQARQAHWRALLLARAIENQACVIGVNRVGRDPHVAYAGGSLIAGARGEILAEAGAGPIVLTADLDFHAVAAWRAEFPALRDIHRELLGSIQIDASIEQQAAQCESS